MLTKTVQEAYVESPSDCNCASAAQGTAIYNFKRLHLLAELSHPSRNLKLESSLRFPKSLLTYSTLNPNWQLDFRDC